MRKKGSISTQKEPTRLGTGFVVAQLPMIVVPTREYLPTLGQHHRVVITTRHCQQNTKLF